jgi:hypothetical protein
MTTGWHLMMSDDAEREEQEEKSPRDVNISWAVGKFFLFAFFCSFH